MNYVMNPSEFKQCAEELTISINKLKKHFDNFRYAFLEDNIDETIKFSIYPQSKEIELGTIVCKFESSNITKIGFVQATQNKYKTVSVYFPEENENKFYNFISKRGGPYVSEEDVHTRLYFLILTEPNLKFKDLVDIKIKNERLLKKPIKITKRDLLKIQNEIEELKNEVESLQNWKRMHKLYGD